MSYPLTLSQGWSKLAEEIDTEIRRARAKFPLPDYLVTALSEEYGESIRAALEVHYARVLDQSSIRDAHKHLRKELIQTAAMCIRLALEGDPVHHITGSVE